MRPEDLGGPTSISRADRGELSFGEKQALKQQHENRGAENRTWEENERLRIQAISVDSGKKAPKYYGAPWVKNMDGGQG